MAENSAKQDETAPGAAKETNVMEDAGAKPLKMSFADWKKSKETKQPPANIGRKAQKNDNQAQGVNKSNNKMNNNNNKNFNNNNNNNNGYAPLNRPPPMPFPLMNMGFGNFGPGPGGPCGPPPSMTPMGNMGPGPHHHRPLQPPPFWEDMMSPQHRPPPIQPPMPKCPSLWNLVPKDKQQQRQNKKQFNQPNKKYKTSNNKKNTSADAALMPPPASPRNNNNAASSSSSSSMSGNFSSSGNSMTSNGAVKKKKVGGAFVQIDGRWIQRPEAPLPLEDAPPGTKEERQRQWKEYRQAMKPFKNREFHNWKRTVQRLSKLPREELDEAQLDRLTKAEEFIGQHKAMLTIRHAEQWVQQNDNNKKPDGANNNGNNVQGEVYVRKPQHAHWDKNKTPHPFQAGPRKQTFGTGRAIKGGLVGEPGCMPPLPVAPPGPIGQFGYFGQTQGYSSNVYGQDAASVAAAPNNSNSAPFYTNYSSSFVKGGTLLPP